MSERERVTIDPAFSLSLPAGWVAEPDEEEGVSVYSPDGTGLLHLVAFPHAPEDEEEEATYWLVGVAMGPRTLVFVSYSCPAGEEEQERAAVREILGTLTF